MTAFVRVTLDVPVPPGESTDDDVDSVLVAIERGGFRRTLPDAQREFRIYVPNPRAVLFDEQART